MTSQRRVCRSRPSCEGLSLMNARYIGLMFHDKFPVIMPFNSDKLPRPDLPAAHKENASGAMYSPSVHQWHPDTFANRQHLEGCETFWTGLGYNCEIVSQTFPE